MADEMTPIEQTLPSEMPAASPAPRTPAIAPAKRNKFLLVGGTFAVIVVVAAAVFFLFGQLSPSPSGDSLASGPGSAAAQTAQPTAAATTTVTPEQPTEVSLTEVFTFRDIFEPLVKPVSTSASTSGDTNSSTSDSTNDNGSGASASSILLQDITVDNGEPTAVVVWEGQTYNVQEGDQVDDSPWEVLDIQESSVVMLYGDTQVVLSIGQQVSK